MVKVVVTVVMAGVTAICGGGTWSRGDSGGQGGGDGGGGWSRG